MKKFILFIFLSISIFPLNLKSQIIDCKKSFVTTLGSEQIDEANQFLSYQDGFLVSGTSNSKFILVHLKENGEINWSYEMDIFVGLTERATNMLLDGENLVIVGNSDVSNGVVQNFILKFSLITNTISWSRVYSGFPFSTSYFTGVLNNEDSYFVLGQTQENSAPGLGCDALWLKVNKNSGSVIGSKNLNLGSCETYTSSIISTDGFIFSAGRFNYAGGGQNKFRGSLTKLDFNGNEIWSKLYSKNVATEDARLYFQSIAEDNGNLIIGGQGDLDGTSTSSVDVLLVKTNLDGEIAWQKEIDIQGASSELFSKVIVSNNGYYLMVNALINSNNVYFIIKVDKNGNLIWSKRYGKQKFVKGNDILITSSNVFVVGETNGFGAGNDDILIVKTDLEGNGLNEMCDILLPVNVTVKSSLMPFEGIIPTIKYDIDFPLTNKFISLKSLTLSKFDYCSSECIDTCQNGLVLHSVPDASILAINVECNGGTSYEVSINLCNKDSVSLVSETPFVVYDANPLTGPATVVYQSFIDKIIHPNNCEIVKFTTNLSENKNYYIVVNDNASIIPPFNLDTDFPNTNIFECDFQNNIWGFLAKSSDTTYITKTLTSGETIQIGQETYNNQGNYVQSLSNIFGCDSTLLIKINVINADLLYNFNNCSAIVGSTNMDYSEFLMFKNSNLPCGEITSSNIHRANPLENKHSCTPGIDNSLAMCVESKNDCVYVPGHERTVKFTLEINPTDDKHIQIHELRFFEKAPENYDWINGPSGLNNYPLKFGFRVLKNNIEIYKNDEIFTAREWNEQKFSFSNNDGFIIEEKSTFQFEFLPYCPVGNASLVSAWDMENLSVFTSCIDKESRILSGQIQTSEGKIITGLSVIKQQNLEFEHKKPDINGNFSFSDIEPNTDCYISVVKNDDYLNGISTLDLVLIQRHILGLEIFDNDRKYIAADINNNNKITASDLVELRKLILGIANKFTNNNSWKFCTHLPAFNPSSKIEVDESYKIIAGLNDVTKLNFKGIKIGDINNDSYIKNEVEPRKYKFATLNYSIDNSYENEYILKFFNTTNTSLYGFQLSLNMVDFDILNIKSDQILIDLDHLFINDDLLNISYSSPNTFIPDPSIPIFSVILKSKNNKGVFKGLNPMFKNEIYYSDMEVRKINLINSTYLKDIDYIKSNPNPFINETLVQYHSVDSSPKNIELYNLTGKLLFSKSFTSTSGWNEIEISSNLLGNLPGIYILRLRSGNESHTLKIVLE